MKDLVILKNRQALTTSLKVAEVFDKRHDNVIQAIETARNNLLNFKDVEKAIIPTTYVDAKGEHRPMYLLNRDGFTFVAMGFTGAKATEFKWNYIQAFNAMEQKLLQLQNDEWREIRSAGKLGNRDMCAVIHDVIIPLAREQGSTAPDKFFYVNYQKAVNKAASISPNSRDDLPIGQLYEVEKLQSMVEVSIKGLAARGDDYKQIYRDTKQTLENYSRLSLIAERFLPA